MTPPLTNHQPAKGAGIEIDLRAFFHVLRERAWFIIGCTLLAAGAAVGYLLATPKTYLGIAVVEVERQAPTVVEIKEIDGSALDSLEAVKTIEAKLGGDAPLRWLLQDKELALTPEKLGLPANVPYTPGQLVFQLNKLITVELIRATRLIRVTAAHTDPNLAAALANGVIRGYMQQSSDGRTAIANEANTFLNSEAARLKHKLEQSEKALQTYKEKTEAVSLEDSQNIVVTKLQALNAKMTEAKADRLKLEAAAEQIRNLKNSAPDQLLAISSVASAPDVIEQRKRLAEISAELANLNERYLEKHPKLIQAKGQFEQVRSNLDRAIVKAAEATQMTYETAGKTEANYAQALREQEQKALELNNTAIAYKVLERDVESERAMFQAVLKRLQETEVTRQLDTSTIRIVEQAVPATAPAKPRKKLIFAIAIGGGMFIGGMLALFLNALDPTLKTVDQIERALGAPVLAAVPRGRRRRRKVLVEANEGLLAEAFRTLRTSLAMLGNETHTFIFTSATEEDGKTFCAINYAAALARAGSHTLLVDADLRKPSVGGALLLGEAQPGLVEVLRGRMPFEKVVRETAVPNLSVVTAGRGIANPAELLHGGSFAEFIRVAAGRYDCVVVDSAPLQAVSDTLLLVKAFDAVCFVVRAGRTNRRAAMKSCANLAAAGAAPAGIVLNGVSTKSRGYYYHYQSGEYGDDVYGGGGETSALTSGAETPPEPEFAGSQSAHRTAPDARSTSPQTANES